MKCVHSIHKAQIVRPREPHSCKYRDPGFKGSPKFHSLARHINIQLVHRSPAGIFNLLRLIIEVFVWNTVDFVSVKLLVGNYS